LYHGTETICTTQPKPILQFFSHQTKPPEFGEIRSRDLSGPAFEPTPAPTPTPTGSGELLVGLRRWGIVTSVNYFTIFVRVIPIPLIDQTVPCERFYTGVCMENARWTLEPPSRDIDIVQLCDTHLVSALRVAVSNGYSIRIGEIG